MIIKGVKELTVKLSNGEEVIIIGGVGDMEDICVTWSGEFDEYIGDLLEDYRMEQNVYRKRDIADKIRDQAYYFANQYGSVQDGDFQASIGPDEFGEEVYQRLMDFIKYGE